MGRARASKGNQYARVLKNKELIGKGSKQTLKEILAKGKSQGGLAKAKEIIKQGPKKSK